MDKKEQAILLASAILKRSDIDIRSNFKDSDEILILFQDINDKRNYEKPITISKLLKTIEESL